jgi:hypothetical protein
MDRGRLVTRGVDSLRREIKRANAHRRVVTPAEGDAARAKLAERLERLRRTAADGDEGAAHTLAAVLESIERMIAARAEGGA